MDLPVDAAIPDVLAALAPEGGRCVLQAPPGAGKTTRVPLALLDALPEGRIVMLEPRRLAVRGAATRMAETLSEPAGRTVGYAMRGERKVSTATRIEVVTDGLLSRRIQSDPALEGVACLIFDEFHERSLDADLALALALEAAEALRPDLRVLVMSATLDAAPVAELIGARIVTSAGRTFPVETRYRERPRRGGERRGDPRALAGLTREALAAEPGSALVFLPGEREIRACAAALEGCGAEVMPLYGAMPLAAQRRAVAPAGGRKVVLATSIAETSLTIEGVRIVIDAGLARRARFDPGTGMGRLVTEPASRAEADQRRGRAGRTEPGVCFRDWTRAEEGAMPPFAPPEIATADLAALALTLAEWGSDTLPFLDPPDPGRLEGARDLLRAFGALNGGSITPHGRAMAALPLHPRLAHMLIRMPTSARLAALLSERDPLRDAGVDLEARLRRWDDPAMASVRREAKRLERLRPSGASSPLGPGGGVSPSGFPESSSGPSRGGALSLAFPDRIGLRRIGEEPRWLLSGGRGAVMPADARLAGERMIVAVDLEGGGREARVRRAAAVPESEVRALHPVEIVRVCEWDRRAGRIVAAEKEMVGALSLSERSWNAPPETLAEAAFEGVRALGLPQTKAVRLMRARAAAAGIDLSDEVLLADGSWLLPWLDGVRDAAAIRNLDIRPALEARLGWAGMRALDEAAPAAFTTPLGRHLPIDYGGGAPRIEVRMQEMFGVSEHPRIGRTRLRVTLLSPAGRPLQVTTDLPGFWVGEYAEVRKEMRGRYPKHPWPEDPTRADPISRAKGRGR